MVAIASFLKRPINVQGKDIILVSDVVGPVPMSEQHQYVEAIGATNTCPAIHVLESDIEEVRERHAGIPVYGMWGILIHSGLVSVKRTLQIVPISDEDGYYVHCNLGRIEYSGIYEAGFFAADAGFNLEEAQVIDVTIDQLVLPPLEAKLAAELNQEKQTAMRQGWSYLALSVMGVVALAFATNYTLQAIYKSQNNEIQNKTRKLMDLQSGLDRLRTTRITEVPDNSKALEKIAALWQRYPNIETKAVQSFSADTISLDIPSVSDDPKRTFAWLESTYDPKGIWTIVFPVKG